KPFAKNVWYSGAGTRWSYQVSCTYRPRQRQVWATAGFRYRRRKFGICSPIIWSQVSNSGCRVLIRPSLCRVFAGVQRRRPQLVLAVAFERLAMLFQHEQVRGNAVVGAEGRIRKAVAADEPQLDFLDGRRAVRVPERGEFLFRQKQLDVVGKPAGESVEQNR